MIAFHKALTSEVINRLMLRGVRLSECEAQQALAGLLTREVDTRGNPVQSNDNKHAIRSGAAKWIEDVVGEVLEPVTKAQLIKVWHDEHPGQNGYPKPFAQWVLELLNMTNDDELIEKRREIIQAAETELGF